MKLFNSKVATIAAAGLIVTLGGATGAYASGAIGGDQIQNNTVDTTEIQNGTVRSIDIVDGEYGVQSRDIKDQSVEARDLAPSVKDGIMAELKADQQLDAKGALITTWIDGMPAIRLPGTYSAMVTLDVQTTGDKPVKVSVGDVFCVAVPVDGLGGQCTASRLASDTMLSVTGADQPGVSVEVNVVRVD